MNLARATLALALCVSALTLVAAEPAKPNSVSVAVKTMLKNEPTRTQVAQYGLCTELTRWGLSVESRQPTAWDKHLEKAKVTVIAPPAPPKEGEKAPEPKKPETALVVEGTIELIYNPTKFYDNDRELTINYIQKVDVKVSDASGKELKHVAWQNYWGTNNDAGHDKVIAECERRCTRFLLLDLLKIEEVAKAIPQERQEELKKFVADEEEYRKKEFDDFETHKMKGEPAKGSDEQK